MKSYTTAQRLKQIMEARSLRQVDILKAAESYCKKYNVKLGKNDLSQYVSGKVEPKQDKLTILGLTLNVSEAWLMGYDVPMEREKPTPVTEDGLEDPMDQQIIGYVKSLTPDQKVFLLAQLKALIEQQ